MTPVGYPVWIDLSSPDLARSREFYARLFGWDIPAGAPELGGYARAMADGREVAGLAPVMPGAPDERTQWIVYLAVDDIDDVIGRALERGAQQIVAPMRVAELGSMAVLSDPAGAVVGLWQADRFAGHRVDDAHGSACWFEVTSRDFDASIAFYRDVIGLQWRLGEEPGHIGRFAMAQTPGSAPSDPDAFCLFAMPDSAPDFVPSYWLAYIAVDDVAATCAAAEQLGATVLTGPVDTPMGAWANLEGPTGEHLGIVQPMRG